MAVIKPQSIDKLSVLTDTITLSPSYSVDYGAIPTISMADITMGNITIGNSGINPTYTVNSGLGYNPNTMWATAGTTTGWNQSAVGATIGQSGTISLKGKDADIDIDGKSLVRWMGAMEERMNWMRPNIELEKEWDDLKELGDRYRELEAKCREKADVWNRLKSMPKPEIK